MGGSRDTGDVAEVPEEQREDVDSYDPDDYGGPPAALPSAEAG